MLALGATHTTPLHPSRTSSMRSVRRSRRNGVCGQWRPRQCYAASRRQPLCTTRAMRVHPAAHMHPHPAQQRRLTRWLMTSAGSSLRPPSKTNSSGGRPGARGPGGACPSAWLPPAVQGATWLRRAGARLPARPSARQWLAEADTPPAPPRVGRPCHKWAVHVGPPVWWHEVDGGRRCWRPPPCAPCGRAAGAAGSAWAPPGMGLLGVGGAPGEPTWPVCTGNGRAGAADGSGGRGADECLHVGRCAADRDIHATRTPGPRTSITRQCLRPLECGDVRKASGQREDKWIRGAKCERKCAVRRLAAAAARCGAFGGASLRHVRDLAHVRARHACLPPRARALPACCVCC